MKRILMVLLAIFLIVPASLKAADDRTVSLTSGFTNVKFDNGYNGFCIDKGKTETTNGFEFTVKDVSTANHNATNVSVGLKLKALFTQYFEEIFVEDGNGGYKIANDSFVQFVIYNITDDGYVYGDQEILANKVKAYNGEEIQDDGHQIVLENGDKITFHFMVVSPDKENVQDFFAYKIEVNQSSDNNPDHEHEFGDWEANDEQHWKECECDEKSDLGNHEGGEATCISKKKCTTCGKEYGTFDLTKHTGNTEVRNAKPATPTEEGYTGDTYCKDCNTLLEEGSVIEKSHEHEFGDWKSNEENHWKECECGEEFELDEHEKTLVNKKEATCNEPGYTGDLVCSVCERLLEEGTVIPAHEHETEWKNDEENHWKECECGEEFELDEHEGGEATCISKKKCSVCGKEYGTFNLTKHTGKTELRNVKEATTEEEGYTGDTHCKDCGTLLVKGKVIAKLHKHEFGDWKTDEQNHWKECECKEKDDLDKHEGGEATCISKKKCSVCGQEYGELDSKNHKAEIEVRGYVAPTKDKEGYTGDTYCKDCDALIKKGTTLSKLGEAPNTGDNSNILLWILAMITSASCCLLLAIKKYKNN